MASTFSPTIRRVYPGGVTPLLFALLSCEEEAEPCVSDLGEADRNCDGLDDRDADGDGAESAALGGPDCDDADPALNPDDADQDGWSTCQGDCADDDPLRGPRGEAVEVCDDIDNDCNGVVDVDDLGVSACELTELYLQPRRVLLDLLLVLDDSGSMTDELNALAEGGPDLLGPLVGTDTHVGITSNDGAAGGKLHGPVGGEPWLDLSLATESQAFAWFSGAASFTTEGTHLARGLDMVVESIDGVVGETWNAGFRRDDAALVVMFVADRDDESTSTDDAEFLLWLAGEVAASGEAGTVHVVVPTDETPPCPGTTGEATIYTGLAYTTSGDTISICTTDYDYRPALAAIGAAEVPAYDVMLQLTVTPIPATLSVDLLLADGASETLEAEEVVYEPFANTVQIPDWAWSEISTVTVRYLVLPGEITTIP
jgi:hypothetical protein